MRHLSIPKERSILFEITNFGNEEKIVPIEMSHKKIINIACSSTHQIAVTADNFVYTWGNNSCGQLAFGNTSTYKKHPACAIYLKNHKIGKCAAGQNFSIFLDVNGALLACGFGGDGCLGHGNRKDLAVPSIIKIGVSGNEKIFDIRCGEKHAAALSSEGRLFTWGCSNKGQLGQGHFETRHQPVMVNFPGSSQIKNVYCGPDATAVLTRDGRVLVSGNNNYNKLGIENSSTICEFTIVPMKFKIVDVSMGENHLILLNDNGTVLGMGAQFNGRFQIVNMRNPIWMSTCGRHFTVVADDRNVLWFWGSYKKCSLDNEPNMKPTTRTHSGETLLENYDTTRGQMEFIKNPQSILALHASQKQIQCGNLIILENILAQNNRLLVVVHTTTTPPYKQFNYSDIHTRNVAIQNGCEHSLTSIVTNLPNASM